MFQACDASEAAEIWESDQASIECWWRTLLWRVGADLNLLDFRRTNPELKLIFYQRKRSNTLEEIERSAPAAKLLRKPHFARQLIELVRAEMRAPL